PRSNLRGPSPARREGGRSARAVSRQVPVNRQSQDCQGDGSNDSGSVPAARRRGDRMRRREFIVLLGGATAALPIAAHAEQTMPAIGYLSTRPTSLFQAFRRGLSENGYVEGRNVTFEYRFSEDRLERLPALADELAGRHVAVIYATNAASALAAKAATKSI